MASIDGLQTELEKIKQRNKRVEGDKAWETSWTRRIFIGVSTYILILILLIITHVENPFLSALIATIGYLISTLSLGILKSWWLKKRI
ncbi:hypothetical protein HY031_01955 [Candidatus Gottesmanbacteria bacterium]|nr:hypothetical protein [Candidatus Gottesmanbacteria bacterium]